MPPKKAFAKKKAGKKVEGTNILKSDVAKFEKRIKELAKDDSDYDISFSSEEEVDLPDFNKMAREDLANVLKQKKKVEQMNEEFIKDGYYLEITKKNFDKFISVFDIPDNYASNYNFKRLLESLYLNYPQVKTLKESEVVYYMKEAIKIYLSDRCVEVIDGKMYVSSDAKWIVEKGWDSVPLDDTSPSDQLTSICINQARLRHNKLDTRPKHEQESDKKEKKKSLVKVKPAAASSKKKKRFIDIETRHEFTVDFELGKKVKGKMKEIEDPTNEQDKEVNTFVTDVRDRDSDFVEADVVNLEGNKYTIRGVIDTGRSVDEGELLEMIEAVMTNIPIKVGKDTVYLY